MTTEELLASIRTDAILAIKYADIIVEETKEKILLNNFAQRFQEIDRMICAGAEMPSDWKPRIVRCRSCQQTMLQNEAHNCPGIGVGEGK